MKILLLLGVLLSTLSFAGTPDQDLIVDIMRERFKASSPNLIEFDLDLNKNWNCVYYNARSGIMPNYTKYKVLFNFKRQEDYTYVNTADFPFKTFKFYEDGHFIGKSGESYLYARKANENTLIFEYASTQYKVRRSYVSVSSPSLAGHAYIYCKKEI